MLNLDVILVTRNLFIEIKNQKFSNQIRKRAIGEYMLKEWHESLEVVLSAQGYTEGFPLSSSDQKTHYVISPERITSLPLGSAKEEDAGLSLDIGIMCRYNKNNRNEKVKEMEVIAEDLLKTLNSYANYPKPPNSGRLRCQEILFDEDEKETIMIMFKILIEGIYITD